MDIAGIGENPKTRSGPQFRIVQAFAAATISVTSSQCARTKPPSPRREVYEPRFSGSSTIDRHAATGVRVARASRQSLSSRERTSGYLSRPPE